MKISRYTKLGILIVVTLTIFIWGLSYLKGHDFFKNTDYYYVRYDRIDGLVESSPITMNGYKIGQVKSIEFDPTYSGDLIITFLINGNFKIPVNSVARIVSNDLMGTKSVKLVVSGERSFYQPYDTIPGAIEGDLKEQVSLQVLPLKAKAEELLATLDSAITVITVIFNEDARRNLAESMANINLTISNLEKTSAELQDLVAKEKNNIQNIIQNVSNVSESFSKKSPEIEKAIGNFAALSDSLASLPLSPLVSDLTEASEQIKEIVGKFNSAETTAGQLLNNDDLYKQAFELLNSFEQLSRDIKANPKRYLHFSALNMGKDVYINTTGQTGNNKSIIFKVHLISTPVKIPLESKLFDKLGRIEEYEAAGAFTYLTGESFNYNEISELHQKALNTFSDATIVAFKNGRLIKLDRALKMSK